MNIFVRNFFEINMIQKIKVYLTSTGREQTADLMKGIAVIFMIQVHIMENFSMHFIYKELPGKFSFFLGGTPAAPVFMIVMGYYLARSNKNLNKMIKRGILLFIGGILLNVALNLNLIYSVITERFTSINLFQYIFGADILPLAGLSIVVISLIKQILEKDWYYYFVTAIIVAFIADYIPDLSESTPEWIYYFTSFIYGSSEWSYFPLFPWLFYPLVGFGFNLMMKDNSISSTITSKIKLTSIIISLLILIATFTKAVDEIIILENYYHHGLFLAFWNVSFVIIWFYLLRFIELKAGESIFILYLKWIGKNVTVVYVIQWIIIGNLATELYNTQNEIQSFSWFIGITIIVSLLTFAYDRFFAVRNLIQK